MVHSTTQHIREAVRHAGEEIKVTEMKSQVILLLIISLFSEALYFTALHILYTYSNNNSLLARTWYVCATTIK